MRLNHLALCMLNEVLCKRLDLCWPQWVHFGSQEHHETP
jgi:hypothetical protein